MTKACTKCGEIKEFDQFSPDKRNRNGLQSQCKACISKAVKDHRKENPCAVSETRKRYYERNADKRRQLSRDIRNRDVDGARKKCFEWRKANPHLVNAGSAKRRALIRKSTPLWADQEKINIQYFMAKFLTDISGLCHEVDHIVPLRGINVTGLHVENNLRVILKSENRIKSNKHIV